MPSLSVGGTTIPVAVSSPSWTRMDQTDRSRAFDGTFRASQTGGAAREWDFATPPVSQALAETYKAALSSPASTLCSGDILQLPTMCSPELMGGTPVRTGSGHNVVLTFKLHESQAARVLLRYAPGDTITGESFSRSTIGTYFTANGTLTDAAINVKRDGHYGPYDAPSRTTRMTLLEDARTNQVLWSSDQSNAAWSKSAASVTTGIPGMRDGVSACTLTATSATGDVYQFLSAGSSLVRTNSIWARRRTGTGQVELYAPDGSTFQILALTTNFKRFTVTGPATTSRKFEIVIRTNGDAIDVENAQMEDGAFMSSEIQTTTVAVTRGADSYSLPFTTPPQESTFYAKFVEGGTVQTVNAQVFGVENAAAAAANFTNYAPAGKYSTSHTNATPAAVLSTLAVAPVIGDSVELAHRLFGDGSVDTTQSIGGATATASTQSAANALATAWSGQLCWLNSAGTVGGVGYVALQSFKIASGARSLSEMRAL